MFGENFMDSKPYKTTNLTLNDDYNENKIYNNFNNLQIDKNQRKLMEKSIGDFRTLRTNATNNLLNSKTSLFESKNFHKNNYNDAFAIDRVNFDKTSSDFKKFLDPLNVNVESVNVFDNNEIIDKDIEKETNFDDQNLNDLLSSTCFQDKDKLNQSNKVNFVVVPYILKLQEFLSSLYYLLKDKKCDILNELNVLSEEWLELLYEIVFSIKENLHFFENINAKVYLIYQQVFNVILYQTNIEVNEKLTNTIMLCINIFEQSNYIIIGLICCMYPEHELNEIKQLVSFIYLRI